MLPTPVKVIPDPDVGYYCKIHKPTIPSDTNSHIVFSENATFLYTKLNTLNLTWAKASQSNRRASAVSSCTLPHIASPHFSHVGYSTKIYIICTVCASASYIYNTTCLRFPLSIFNEIL